MLPSRLLPCRICVAGVDDDAVVWRRVHCYGEFVCGGTTVDMTVIKHWRRQRCAFGAAVFASTPLRVIPRHCKSAVHPQRDAVGARPAVDGAHDSRAGAVHKRQGSYAEERRPLATGRPEQSALCSRRCVVDG
jgi:hypothetical protein